MATDISSLIERAQDIRRRLEEQGATEDARVIEQLVAALTATQAEPETTRPYYTVTEAAEFVGVSGQTIKNWARRGMLKAYRLGGRIVIPRGELDDYRPLAEASKALDPTPSREEIVETIRAGRRPFVWPIEPKKESEE
jgi:excisionase family DNA binding protein